VIYAINERMARRIDHLLEEVRVLREVYSETTGRKRIPFTSVLGSSFFEVIGRLGPSTIETQREDDA
jgi:hypothetical protein